MSTYASLHYHIVFSTKARTNFIHRTWEERLHEYLGGVVRKLEGYPQGIGGIEDHVHLLVGLKPTHCISDFMRELKRSSSRWVHSEIGQGKFAWQDGYSVFSVSADARSRVKGYIAKQRNHHLVKSFRDEVIEMLNKAGVEYDPKYLD
jgi:REP element-mobilizing transposase RayT